MEAPTSKLFLDRAINQLLMLYDVCDQKKRQCEQVCQDCRRLMKPWPKKKKETTETAKCPDANVTDKPVPVDDTSKIQDEPDIQLVKQLLNKAQSSRKRAEYRVQTETKELSTSEVSSPEVECSEKRANAVAKPPSGKRHEITNKAQSVVRMQGPHLVSREGPKSSSRPPVSTTAKPDSKNRSMATSKQMSGSSAVKSSVGVIKKSSLDKILQPALSTNSSKSVHKVVPAHQKAPFKTEVRRPVSGHKKLNPLRSKSCDRQGGGTVSSNLLARDRGKSEKVIPQQQRICRGNLMKTSSDSDLCHTKVMSEREQKLCSREESDGVPLDKPIVDSQSAKEGWTKDNVTEHAGDESKKEVVAETPFCILRDGKKLSVSSKLRRTFMSNVRLRQKVNAVRLTRKVDEHSQADQFMRRMLQQLEKDNPDTSTYGRVVKICREYATLQTMWDNLRLDLDEEMSSATDVLLVKRTIEHIVIRCNELEKDYHILIKELNSSPRQNPVMAQKVSSDDIWLPDWIDYRGVAKELKSKTRYKNLKELFRLQDCLHNIQSGLCQLHVLEAVAGEVIPFLTNAEVDSKFVDMYRTTYGLLCSYGQMFPAMVADQEETN